MKTTTTFVTRHELPGLPTSQEMGREPEVQVYFCPACFSMLQASRLSNGECGEHSCPLYGIPQRGDSLFLSQAHRNAYLGAVATRATVNKNLWPHLPFVLLRQRVRHKRPLTTSERYALWYPKTFCEMYSIPIEGMTEHLSYFAGLRKRLTGKGSLTPWMQRLRQEGAPEETSLPRYFPVLTPLFRSMSKAEGEERGVQWILSGMFRTGLFDNPDNLTSLTGDDLNKIIPSELFRKQAETVAERLRKAFSPEEVEKNIPLDREVQKTETGKGAVQPDLPRQDYPYLVYALEHIFGAVGAKHPRFLFTQKPESAVIRWVLSGQAEALHVRVLLQGMYMEFEDAVDLIHTMTGVDNGILVL